MPRESLRFAALSVYGTKIQLGMSRGRKKKTDSPTWSVAQQIKELDGYILKYEKFARLWPDCASYEKMVEKYKLDRAQLTQ